MDEGLNTSEILAVLRQAREAMAEAAREITRLQIQVRELEARVLKVREVLEGRA